MPGKESTKEHQGQQIPGKESTKNTKQEKMLGPSMSPPCLQASSPSSCSIERLTSLSFRGAQRRGISVLIGGLRVPSWTNPSPHLRAASRPFVDSNPLPAPPAGS